MRELKFRAWDKQRLLMINGLAITAQGKLLFTTGRRGKDKGFSYRLFPAYDETKFEVMQFTGLKDKNGKEIWEGDIVLVFDEAAAPVTDDGRGPMEECNHIVSVEMRDGVWGFDIRKTDDGETGWYGLHYWKEDISSSGYEVIGNIYENPEFLNEDSRPKP